jgi:cation-transporting ATPase 13A3/4/5
MGKNEKSEDMYIGDPLEIEMFKFAKWKFIDIQNESGEIMLTNICPIADNSEHYVIGSIKMFDFSSKLQRMSVIVKNKRSKEIRCFCKGSPEKIKELCLSGSLPQNYNIVLNRYAQQGCRIIALATKPLSCTYNEAILMQREELECDLLFLGFLIMQNRLKDVTGSVILELGNANIKSIMATGDNIYTAVSVGRECNIVDPKLPVYLGDTDDKNILRWVEMKSELLDGTTRRPSIGEEMLDATEDAFYTPDVYNQLYQKNAISKGEDKKEESDYIEIEQYIAKKQEYAIAMTGKAFNTLMASDPKVEGKVAKAVIKNGYIFARMTPDGKATLVDRWQLSRKIMIGMCGDGANDCMALRTADMGVSLSQAEASIAAPFTSKVPDISCIPTVLKEGRTALVTSIQCFKFMALYSMIEFMTVTMMYLFTTNISDNQFLYIDLVLIIPIATTMSWSRAYPVLSKEQPTSALISFIVLLSVIGQIAIQLLFQVHL